MLTIERAGVEAIDTAMIVMREAFDPRYGEAWTPGQCTGVLAMPGSALLIARDPGPCGFALVRVVLDESELMLIAVRPQARGRGIGRALLCETFALATQRGAAACFLEVRGDNPAIALYQSEGLVCVGRRQSYYRGNDGATRDAMTFRRALA